MLMNLGRREIKLSLVIRTKTLCKYMAEIGETCAEENVGGKLEGNSCLYQWTT